MVLGITPNTKFVYSLKCGRMTAFYFQVTIQNNSQINITVHRSANNQPNNLHEFPSVTSEKLDI